MSGVSRFLAEFFYRVVLTPDKMPSYNNPGWALDPGAYQAVLDLFVVGANSIAMVLQTAQCLQMTTMIPKGKIQWWSKCLWIVFPPILWWILNNVGVIFIFTFSTIRDAIVGSLPTNWGPFDWARMAIGSVISIAVVVMVGFALFKASLRSEVLKHVKVLVAGMIAVGFATLLQLQSASTSMAPIAWSQFGIPIERVQVLMDTKKTLLGEISGMVDGKRYVCIQRYAETAFLTPAALEKTVQAYAGIDGACQQSSTKAGFNTQLNLFYLAFTSVASFVSTFFLGDGFFNVIPSAAEKVAENLGVKAPRNTQRDAVALFQGILTYVIINVLLREILFAFDTVSSVFGEAVQYGLLSPSNTKNGLDLFKLLLTEKDGKLLLGLLFFKWGFFVPMLCSAFLPFCVAGVIRLDVEAQYEAIHGPLTPATAAAQAVAAPPTAIVAVKPTAGSAQKPKNPDSPKPGAGGNTDFFNGPMC
jgi:hypothetical protein